MTKHQLRARCLRLIHEWLETGRWLSVGNVAYFVTSGTRAQQRSVRAVLLELEAEGLIAIDWFEDRRPHEPKSRIRLVRPQSGTRPRGNNNPSPPGRGCPKGG